PPGGRPPRAGAGSPHAGGVPRSPARPPRSGLASGVTSRAAASTLGPVHDARGWVLGGGELALLEEEGGSDGDLRLIDAEGGELGRLSGAAASALRARLAGAPASPLLARVLGAL